MYVNKKALISVLFFIVLSLTGCEASYNNSSFSDTVETLKEAQSFTLVGDNSTYYYDGEVVYFETGVNENEEAESFVGTAQERKYYYDIAEDKFYVFNNEAWYMDDYRVIMIHDLQAILMNASKKEFIVGESGGTIGLSNDEWITIFNDDQEKDLSIALDIYSDYYIITDIDSTSFERPNLSGALLNEVVDIRVQAFMEDAEYDFYTYESVEWLGVMHLYATFTAYPEEKYLDFDSVNPDIDFELEAGLQQVTVSYYGMAEEFEFFFYDPDTPLVFARYIYDSDFSRNLGYCNVSELATCDFSYDHPAFEIDSWHIIEENNGNAYFGDYKDITVSALIKPVLKPISVGEMLEYYEASELSFIRAAYSEAMNLYFLSETELYDVSSNDYYVYTDLVNHESFMQYANTQEWIATEESNVHAPLQAVLDLVKTLEFETSVGKDQDLIGQYRVELDSASYDGIESINIDFEPDKELIQIMVRRTDSEGILSYEWYYIYYDGNPVIHDGDQPFETELKKP